MTTPRTHAVVLLAATLALAGCGDDKKDTASSQSAQDSGSDSTTNGSDESAPAPAGSDEGFTMPGVTANATDLSKEPKADKGAGNGPATLATVAGTTQVIFCSTVAALPFLRDGSLKPIAFADDTRSKELPRFLPVLWPGAFPLPRLALTVSSK